MQIKRLNCRSKLLWYNPGNDQFSKEKTKESSLEIGMPYTVCIQTSRLCNYKCRICVSDSAPSNKLNSTSDWVSESLILINRYFGAIRTVWSGGEPTLIPEIKNYLNLSKKLGNVNLFVTNASKFIENLNIDWLDVSIYGANENSFEEFTGSKMFLRHIDNLKLYCSAYSKVSASIVLGVYSSEELQKMVSLAIDCGVKGFKFHRLSRRGRFEFPIGHDGIHEEQEVMLHEYLKGAGVQVSFSRTKSSKEKSNGYWVLEKNGMLTNMSESVDLSDAHEVANVINKYKEINNSLFEEKED